MEHQEPQELKEPPSLDEMDLMVHLEPRELAEPQDVTTHQLDQL